MIGMGIIGCGSIVRVRHAPECALNENVEIKGFYNPTEKRAEEMAVTYGGKVYKTIDELLEDRDIEAVIIAAPNRFHGDLAVRALEAGKHVLCEKPCVISRGELKQLRAAVNHSETIFMAAQNQRFEPVHIEAKRLLKKGEIGEIISVFLEFSHGGPEKWSIQGEKNWFLDKDISGLGVLGDLGIHKIDLLRWILEEDIIAVTADLNNFCRKNRDGEALNIDDHALCRMETKSGKTAVILASWCNYGICRNWMMVYGTKGTMLVDLEAKSKQIQIHRGVNNIIEEYSCKDSGKIVDVFVDGIVKGNSPVGIDEVEKDMEVIFGAYESSKTKKKIYLGG